MFDKLSRKYSCARPCEHPTEIIIANYDVKYCNWYNLVVNCWSILPILFPSDRIAPGISIFMPIIGIVKPLKQPGWTFP